MMPCHHIKVGGAHAIVCAGRGRRRRQRCVTCKADAPFLCDWKIAEGKTCDNPICAAHALEVAPDKHLCPEHQDAYAKWKERRAA